MMQVYQKKAFKEIRNMWTLMLTTPSPDKLLSQLYKVSAAEGMARFAYRNLLTNHNYSSQVLRSYALFLSEVHGNEVEAQRYTDMADDLDEEASNEKSASRTFVPQSRSQKNLKADAESSSDDDSNSVDGISRHSSHPRLDLPSPAVSFRRASEDTVKVAAAGTGIGTAQAAPAAVNGVLDVTSDIGDPSHQQQYTSPPPAKRLISNSTRFADDNQTATMTTGDLPGSITELATAQSSPEAPNKAAIEMVVGTDARPYKPTGRTYRTSSLQSDAYGHTGRKSARLSYAGEGADLGSVAGAETAAHLRRRAEKAAVADAAAEHAGVELVVPVNLSTATQMRKAQPPSQLTGIRFFRVLLLTLMLATAAFTLIPLVLNVYLLNVLVENVGIVAASVRREFLVWSAGNMVADMQNGRYYLGTDDTRVPMEELLGELAYLEHHLNVCAEAGDEFTWFTQFAHSVPTCSNRRTNPVAGITSTVYDVKSVQVNGTIQLQVISSNPPASDQIQYLLYAMEAVATYPESPLLVQAQLNYTSGLPVTDYNISMTDYSVWGQSAWQS
jgi:hypothetical protein